MFGWFSKKQAALYGFAIFKSVNGETVIITEITDDHRQPPKFPDVEYVGEVVDFMSNFPVIDKYEELSEEDIIDSEELILTDIKHENAKMDWVRVFVKYVNVRQLFGAGTLMQDKHPPYYGAE